MTIEGPSRFGVRGRILATVLVLAALGMSVSGAAFTVLQRRQAFAQADSTLIASAGEFNQRAQRVAAKGSIDGEAITVRGLLDTALTQHFSSNGEELIGIVNGRYEFETRVRAPAAHDDPAFKARMAALQPTDAPQIDQVETATSGLVRYVAVPVSVVGDPNSGYFVSLISMKSTLAQLQRNAWAYTGMSMIALVLLGLGGWFVAGRLLQPLRLINNAARSISHTDLSARIPVSGHDDLSNVTRTVNSMLDRLQKAFNAQQAFLDDAGHELRTPLTIVRGHLEVIDENSPDDVRATRTLVIDELDRMARLVNDLIVLAQSGRPDFVRMTTVDLDELLCDIHAKVPALAERNWVLEELPGVVVEADAHRLTQALLQLTDNAVRYTTEHDTIALGGRRDVSGVIELWIRDTGPGVPAADRDRIFMRFGRGDWAHGEIKPDDSRSSGLGLSIVSGIATAHGGLAILDTLYSEGARFILRLPLRVISLTRRDMPDSPVVLEGLGRASQAQPNVLTSLFQPYTNAAPRSASAPTADQEYS